MAAAYALQTPSLTGISASPAVVERYSISSLAAACVRQAPTTTAAGSASPATAVKSSIRPASAAILRASEASSGTAVDVCAPMTVPSSLAANVSRAVQTKSSATGAVCAPSAKPTSTDDASSVLSLARLSTTMASAAALPARMSSMGHAGVLATQYSRTADACRARQAPRRRMTAAFPPALPVPSSSLDR